MIKAQPQKSIAPTALKRIYRDLKEIEDNPLPGISLCMPDSADPLTLHGNIYIMDGPYREMLIHIIVHLPPDYPVVGPAVNIAPGLKFNRNYHEHLIDDDLHGSHVCTDLLTNVAYMYEEGKTQKSGWTPSYTLSSALIQLQVFFADPDLPHLPSKTEIEALRKHVREFKMTINLSEGKTIMHTSENPYPPLPLNLPKKDEIIPNKDAEEEIKEPDIRKESEQWLYCAISKCTIFDDSNPILGYPLDITKDRFGRYWPTPILEMISYESFVQNIANDPNKIEDFENVKFKSSFGEAYNFWIPVYINDEHYKRGRQHIFNAISTVCRGFQGFAQNDFKPSMVLQVLPVILNKMIVKILKDELHQSVAAIQAYAHFYRLMMKMLEEFPELQEIIDSSVEKIRRGESERSKEKLGDMGEFLIKLALSKYGIKDPEINELLIEEYLARNVFWIFKDEPGFANRQLTPKAFVEGFVNHSKVSHQIYVVAVETANLMKSDVSLTRIDMRNGLLPKPLMEEYFKKIEWIRSHVAVNGNWDILCRSFCLDSKIKSETDMSNLLIKAFDISSRQGYSARRTLHIGEEQPKNAKRSRSRSNSKERRRDHSRNFNEESRDHRDNRDRDRRDEGDNKSHRHHENRYEHRGGGRHDHRDGGRHEHRDDGRHEHRDGGRHDHRDGGRHDHRRDDRSHSRDRDEKGDRRQDSRSSRRH